MWQCKGARTTKTAWGGERTHSHILLSKLITQSYRNQDCDSGIRIRHTDQQYRTENSEINPSLHLRSTVFLFFFLCPQCHMACRILVLHTGIEPVSSRAKAQSPNLRTARKFPNVNRYFYKGSRTIQHRKNSLQQMVLEQLNIHTWKSDPYLTPSGKINSKQIKDLHVTCKTLKFLRKTIGINICYLD